MDLIKFKENLSNQELFLLSCLSGHRDVAEMLYNLSKPPIDIHIRNDFLFREACTTILLHLNDHLYTLIEIYDHSLSQYGF